MLFYFKDIYIFIQQEWIKLIQKVTVNTFIMLQKIT